MLAGKYPSYYMALRVGRELQSLCVASDPERTTLTEMLDELKQKWFAFKLALTEKYVCHKVIWGATPKFLGGPNPFLHLSPSFPFTFSSPSPVSFHPLRSRPLK